MLKKVENIDNALDFSNAEVGDAFYIVNRHFFSIHLCKVIRAGKRDVVFMKVGEDVPEGKINKRLGYVYDVHLTTDKNILKYYPAESS